MKPSLIFSLKLPSKLTQVITPILTALLVSGLSSSTIAAEMTPSKQALSLAQDNIIIDGHIDVPYRLEDVYSNVTVATKDGDFDYPRAKKGGLNAPFMSIYIPATMEQEGGGKALADRLIDRVEAIVGRAPEKFALVKNLDELKKNFSEGKISLPMGMENGTPINGKMENLHHFYQRGIRYITLAHSKSNHISDSSYDTHRQWHGLSPFGKKLVVEMNNVGVMVDVSHISDEAFYQVMAVSKVPVIASHSSLRHFTPGFERNMNDDMLKALKKNGGVIQINFGSSFVTKKANEWNKTFGEKRTAFLKAEQVDRSSEKYKSFAKAYKEQLPYPYATLAEVVDHIDHVVKLVGINHVGLGSDFDGVGDSLPTDLKDVSQYPNLVQELLKRNYSQAAIKKILGDNVIRVWQAAEDYANKQSLAMTKVK